MQRKYPCDYTEVFSSSVILYSISEKKRAKRPRLFYQISLEYLVPKEHLVRRLAEVLDFSWVRSATESLYSHTGRPSIDPVVVAKLLLLGYLYNIDSERQLMREVQVNMAYRWYMGYDLDEEIPDHSILSKARRRFGLVWSFLRGSLSLLWAVVRMLD